MPRMTPERRRLMIELQDYPQDIVSQFLNETRNWTNRDAARLEYVAQVKNYQRNLENYYGEFWPQVVASRYSNVTLAERMFAKPPATFKLGSFYERIGRPNYVAEREAGYQANYVKGLVSSGRMELAERVAMLSPRQWVAFSLNAPPIELHYKKYDDDDDPVGDDVKDSLERAEQVKELEPVSMDNPFLEED